MSILDIVVIFSACVRDVCVCVCVCVRACVSVYLRMYECVCVHAHVCVYLLNVLLSLAQVKQSENLSQ